MTISWNIQIHFLCKLESKYLFGLYYNSAENEIRYIIVTATEGRDRGECHIRFPSLTFQNSEEGGNKSPKRRFMNKRIV